MYLTSTLAACREAAQGRTHNRIEVLVRCPGCWSLLRITDREDPDGAIEYHTTSTCTHPDTIVLGRRSWHRHEVNEARQERRAARGKGPRARGLTSQSSGRSLEPRGPAPRRTGHSQGARP